MSSVPIDLANQDVLFTPGAKAEAMYFVLNGRLLYMALKRRRASITSLNASADSKNSGAQATVEEQIRAGLLEGGTVQGRGDFSCEQALWVDWVHRGGMTSVGQSQ